MVNPTLAEWMTLALYHPDTGYYTSGTVAFGDEAHFWTFPERLSPTFGRVVARQLVAMHRALVTSGALAPEADFTVVELGAGEGWLALDVLDAVDEFAALGDDFAACSRALRYRIGDRATALRARQRERLAAAFEAGRVAHLDQSPDDLMPRAEPFVGVVLSNELFDVYPHELLRLPAPGVVERMRLELDGEARPTGASFERVDPVGALGAGTAAYLAAIEPVAAQRRAVAGVPELLCAPGMQDFMAWVGANLTAGFVLTIDYGGSATHCLDPQPFAPHLRVYPEPPDGNSRAWLADLGPAGTQDVTVDIDFSHLAHAGLAHGLSVVGFVPQGDLATLAADASQRIDPLAKDERARVVRRMKSRGAGEIAAQQKAYETARGFALGSAGFRALVQRTAGLERFTLAAAGDPVLPSELVVLDQKPSGMLPEPAEAALRLEGDPNSDLEHAGFRNERHAFVAALLAAGLAWITSGCGDDAAAPSDAVADAADSMDALGDITDSDIFDLAFDDSPDTFVTSDSVDTLDSADTTPPRTHGLERRELNTTCALNGTPPLTIVPVATAPMAFESHLDGLDLATLRAAVVTADGHALVVARVSEPLGADLALTVTRYALSDDGAADLSHPTTLLDEPMLDLEHAGGALAVMRDGSLMVALGDGGDPETAAEEGSHLGKLLRFATASQADAIEVYANGLRAPTSCAIDRVTGRLWCADRVADDEDGIIVVTAGATLFPIQRVPHESDKFGCDLIVGPVARDAALPDIQGALVYGTRCDATLRALRFDGSLIRSDEAIATLPAPLAAFVLGADGQVLAIDDGGQAHALVAPPRTDDRPAPTFPATLGATGCLTSLITRTPAPGLVPYEVRAPLWSDGAAKRRFVALPGDARIGFAATGPWGFPDGTLFMKEFLDGERIMETRFLVKRSDALWEGYSYAWDPNGQEAFLLDGSAVIDWPANAATTAGGDDDAPHRHTYPDRAQCLLCHNAGAGRALGLVTGRMNTDHDYDGFVDNQLAAMDYVGLFDAPLPAAPADLPRYADPYAPDDAGGDAVPGANAASVEARARAWLYANCAHCHTPGGSTPVPIDLRVETAFADTKTCGLSPKFVIAQVPDAHIITPGDPDQSELFFRMSRRDRNQMPPIATLEVDPIGVDLVRRWIAGLTACP